MKLKMKWALNNEGKKAFLGYEIMAENKREELALGTIRNWQFWGFDDTELTPKDMKAMEYQGVTLSEDGRRAVALRWGLPQNEERLKKGELHEPFEETF